MHATDPRARNAVRFCRGWPALLLIGIAGCAPVKPPTPAPVPEPAPVATPAPSPPPENKSASMALSWDDVPARVAWSHALLDDVRRRKAELDQGNAESFLPGYNALSADDQVKFWAELVIAIAKYESTWNAHAQFKEPPPLNVQSIGLLQIAYEDQAEYHFEPPLDRNAHALDDPLVNLRCGVAILAQLVAHDGAIVGGTGDRSRGAARYWAVLRAGKSHHLADIKALVGKNLGMR